MTQDSLATQLNSGTPTFGTFFKSHSPVVAENLGQTPLDFLVVDRQHASPDLETIESIIRAADLHELEVMVRVPRSQHELINNVLDMGAQAIMVPQVHSPDDLYTIIDQMDYTAERSFAMSTRAGTFGSKDRESYLEWCDQHIALVPQIESEGGLENVESIAALNEVTAVMIGPGDLGISLGVEPGSPELLEAIDSIYGRVEDLDCGIGTYLSGPPDEQGNIDRSTFMVLNSDIGSMSSWFSSTLGSL